MVPKIWPKDPVERLLEEAIAYLKGEPLLKRNLTNLAQPIAEAVAFPRQDTAYNDMLRRLGEKPAAKYLGDLSPLDATLWEHFQTTSLFKDKVRRWQNRRMAEDRSVLAHEETLDALHAWQQQVRQAHIEETQKTVRQKIRIASEETAQQTQKIADSNTRVLERRALNAYKGNADVDEHLDGVRARAANIAFFRQWIVDVQHTVNEKKLLDRNERLQLKLNELNLLVAAHESAVAYGTKPQLVSPASPFEVSPHYRIQPLNPYKKGG